MMIEIVINPGVVSVIIGLVDAVLDERSNTEIAEVFTEPVAVVALVSGEDSQLARVSAGELLTDFRITSGSGGRAVHIENHLCICVDEFRRFERLNAVICPLAVVAACT